MVLADITGRNFDEFLLKVQMGKVPGARITWRFGQNPDIDDLDTEDIWDFGGIYTELDGPTTLYGWSTAADTQTIQVQGLDENYNACVETFTLTGTTPVALPCDFITICEVKNISSTPITGTVYVSRVSGSVLQANVVATILPTYQTSNLGRCAIPVGYTGFLFYGTASVSLSSPVNVPQADVYFYVKKYNGVFTLVEEITTGGNGVESPRPWLPLPEKTLMKTKAKAYDENASVRTSFGVLLLDNDMYDLDIS